MIIINGMSSTSEYFIFPPLKPFIFLDVYKWDPKAEGDNLNSLLLCHCLQVPGKARDDLCFMEVGWREGWGCGL